MIPGGWCVTCFFRTDKKKINVLNENLKVAQTFCNRFTHSKVLQAMSEPLHYGVERFGNFNDKVIEFFKHI